MTPSAPAKAPPPSSTAQMLILLVVASVSTGFVQIGEMGATLAEGWRSWGALWLQTLIYGLIAAYLMGRQRRAANL